MFFGKVKPGRRLANEDEPRAESERFSSRFVRMLFAEWREPPGGTAANRELYAHANGAMTSG